MCSSMVGIISYPNLDRQKVWISVKKRLNPLSSLHFEKFDIFPRPVNTIYVQFWKDDVQLYRVDVVWVLGIVDTTSYL